MIVHEVEQNSEEWYALRAGRPTASEFSKLVTTLGAPTRQQDKYIRTLAGEKYTGKPAQEWEGNTNTERGHELEAEAVKAYEFLKGVEVGHVGFVTDNKGLCGCSPDGLVGDDGMIEIKTLNVTRFVEEVLFYKRNKRVSSNYFIQPQGQMMICDRKWCDLVFYHPDFPLHIVRQKPDIQFQKDLMNNIKVAVRESDKIVGIMEKML